MKDREQDVVVRETIQIVNNRNIIEDEEYSESHI
jgi:hypothetical protein